MPRKKSKPRRRHAVRLEDGVALPHRLVLPWEVEWNTLPCSSSTKLNFVRGVNDEGFHDVEENTDSPSLWYQRYLDSAALVDRPDFVDSSDDDSIVASAKKRSPNDDSYRNNERKRRRRSPSVDDIVVDPRRSRSKPLPRIGKNYQVGEIPVVGTCSVNASVTLAEPEPLWDPSRASPTAWDWLETKPCRDETLAMRALHESNYRVESAVEWLEDKKASMLEEELDPGILYEVFENFEVTDKKVWFRTIAQTIGTSISQVITNYYRWKTIKPEEYRRIFKNETRAPTRQPEPIEEGKQNDYCAVCHDGGYLMECSGCGVSYHHKCLNMAEVPDGDWYCIECEQKQSGWRGSMKYLNLGARSYLLVVPTTPGKGLGLTISYTEGKVTLEAINRHDAPSEWNNGDVLVGINEVSVRNETYQEIVKRLKNLGDNVAVGLELERAKTVSQDLSDDDEAVTDVKQNHSLIDAARPSSTISHEQEASTFVKAVSPHCYELRLPLSYIFNRLTLTETEDHILLKMFDFPTTDGLPRKLDRLCAINGCVLRRKTLNEAMSLIGKHSTAREQVLMFAQNCQKGLDSREIKAPLLPIRLNVLSGKKYEIRAPIGCIFGRMGFVERKSGKPALVLSKLSDQLASKGPLAGDRLLSVNGTRIKHSSLSLVAASMGRAEYEKEQVMVFGFAHSPIYIHPLTGDQYEMHLPVRRTGLLGIAIAKRSDGRVVLSHFVHQVWDPAKVIPAEGDAMMAIDGIQVDGMDSDSAIAILKSHNNLSKRVILWQRERRDHATRQLTGQSLCSSVGKGAKVGNAQNGAPANLAESQHMQNSIGAASSSGIAGHASTNGSSGKQNGCSMFGSKRGSIFSYEKVIVARL